MRLVQPGDRLHRQVDHGAAGHRVEDDRQAGRAGDGGEVCKHPLLRRLVVVGHHRQDRIGTDLFGEAGQGHGLGGRVRPGPGDHRHAPVRHLHGQLDDAAMLLMRHRRAFASGADGNEAVRPLGDLPLHEALQGFLIQRPVCERSEQRCNGASQHFGGSSSAKKAPAWGAGVVGGAGHRLATVAQHSPRRATRQASVCVMAQRTPTRTEWLTES